MCPPQLVLTLALLFLASVLPSSAQSPAEAVSAAPALAANEEGIPLVQFDVRGPLELNCTGLVADVSTLVWTKNGSALNALSELTPRLTLAEGALLLRRTTEDDFGNYTCAAPGGGPTRSWRVHARPHAKLAANVNVVEEQKLKLQCKLVGKPYPAVVWTYTNASEPSGNQSGVEVTAALGTRVSLRRSEQGVEGGELVLEPAARADAGWYTCTPEGGASATTALRVKDKYAALWPFLGICAEVLVLCAVILVYEKRRTKPELDDSDTDNHDQKKS